MEALFVKTAQVQRLGLLVPAPTILKTHNELGTIRQQTIKHFQFESSKLADLRDYHLPHLLSGQVQVSYAASDALAEL